MHFTHYHSQYFAHRITLAGIDDDSFAQSLSTARVHMNPHQVDAALFALQAPMPRGAILADEVGLGKTIEASLVIAQRWAEKRRRILLIVPASLRKQWSQELREKFGLEASILEAKSYKEAKKAGHRRPFEIEGKVVITSYEFAAIKEDDLTLINWDLVVFDEAHRLRNVYKKAGSVKAKALQRSLKNSFKILLTATPLQNSLMELFGLVSMIDEHIFGDEASFKIHYSSGKPTPASLAILRERIKTVCLRTLRKDVQEAGHISYTKRLPSTFTFEPYDDEQKLYEHLSAFLQRKDTVSFGDKPNQLVTLVVRKILGSSTFAVADTLSAIIDRLKKLQPVTVEDLADLSLDDGLAEEWAAGEGEDEDADSPQIDAAKLKAEIEELTSYLKLARSIPHNAKGRALLDNLTKVLDTIAAKPGGQRKAVIFTESVRTQKYLAELLSAHGFADQIVLMNGSNNDALSQSVYQGWKARHTGTDAVSGSKTADMKAAIVESFKDDKTILIATESGAEGINLQFCSLLINFDLPWNPQRVEQRIGRCHRYGQKIDVMVINFLNTKNRAEERILELLTIKFNLFSGVFGASDDVLGAIESGTDFERRVFEAVQNARNNNEIDAAFNRLQDELSEKINTEMLDARNKLIGHFDQNVVKRLKDRKEKLSRIIDVFEERLLALAKAELADASFFDYEGHPCFTHKGQTYTTNWELADKNGWQFFRLADDNLASQLVANAKTRQLSQAELNISYAGFAGEGQLTDVKALIGKSGWLSLARLGVKSAKADAGSLTTIENLVMSGLLDDGAELPTETLERLFQIPGVATSTAAEAPINELKACERRLVSQFLDDAKRRNAEFLEREEIKLDSYADDLETAAKEEIKRLEDEIKVMKKEARAAESLEDKIEKKRAIKKREGQRDDLSADMFQRKKSIRKKVDDLLEELSDNLKVRPEVTPIFIIRFSVTE
jgi:superfamily II DNA or RNA helicase